jgi:hypothetical protein
VGGKATKAVCCAAPRRLCVAWAIMRRERGLRKDALFLSYFISPFASDLAMAAPIPLDAPVTTATLPVSLLMCSILVGVCIEMEMPPQF